jgi:hypothetical protein
MSCRRICRELLWLVRFGSFDAQSAPHLEHLSGCSACRDEVGLDRALVRQLRTALEARVGVAIPSPAAWDGVLERMRQPEPRLFRLRSWPVRFAAALRAGTAMAGAGLALVLALNLEVVPIGPVVQPEPVPNRQGGSPDGIPQWIEISPIVQAPATDDAGRPTADGEAVPPAEQLPITRFGREADADQAAQPIDTTDDEARPEGWQVIAIRLVPADAVVVAGGSAGEADDGADEPNPIPDPPMEGPS